jgi:hypothetical protein
MTLNRPIIDPEAYNESEKAFRHAEQAGIVLEPRHIVKAVIRCNQMRWDGVTCEWSYIIEARAVDIETQVRNRLIGHIRREHRDLDAVATADRRWVTLRDIGG